MHSFSLLYRHGLLQGLLLCSLTLIISASAETVWWEAEDAKDTSMPVVNASEETISGGRWLYGKVQSELHATYEVKVTDGGRYSFYLRRYWLHGSFRWRFDSDEWAVVETQKMTILDKKESQLGPMYWVDLGYVNLKPGAHTLEIEILPDSPYAYNKVYGFDCFVLSNDGFVPLGVSHEGGPRSAAAGNAARNEAEFGKFLPRTMSLLSSSTAEQRQVVTILFYGQSIVANCHIDLELSKFLRARYPNAIIQFKNLAIGGYQAPILRKTAWQDMYPLNPDLIVFHVYGGESTGEMEEIFKTIRENMTAEVITWTHHVDNFGTGIDEQRDVACEAMKKLAAKYGFELADARTLWKERLKETHLDPQTFLVDQIHLNTKGTALLLESLSPHFITNPNANPDSLNRVKVLPLSQPTPQVSFDSSAWNASPAGLTSNGIKPLRIEFTGNRLDLVPVSGSTGTAKILLDGKTPSSQRTTLAVSRSTLAPGSWWPAITQVNLADNTVAEKITMTFHNISPDGNAFTFDVTGSVSGGEGNGKSGTDFTAKSGHFSIKADDIALASVKKTLKKDLPTELTVEWEIYSMSRDLWPAAKPGTANLVLPVTAVRTWAGGKHTVEIVPNGDGPVGLKEARIFSPNPL
jgi:hypothetical protein